MKIEKTWNASSNVEKLEQNKDLIEMAGQWGVGIEVTIIKPYKYSQGPIECTMATDSE